MPEDVTQGAERDRRLPEAWEEDAAMSKRARVGGGITASRLNKPNSSFFSFSNLGRRFRHSSTSTGTWSIGQCIAMTATEAPWRVKSRPCPFYQQGKCLFADSCNFLHNVQIKVPGGPTAIHASPATEALQRTPEGPAVIVDSPRSMRSPPRSPRMNSLLQALKGVISEDEEEDDSEDSGSEPAASSAEDVGMEEPAEREAHDAPNEQDRRASQPPSAAHQDDYNDSQEVTARQSIPVALHEDREQSPEYEEDSSHSTNSAPTPDILSPVDLSHLRLSGLDQFVHAKGNNSFDSGYAENWQSPQRFALSPPRSPSVVSTFGLLSSPFGSPSERVFGSPRAHMFGNIPSSPLATGANAFSHDENEQEDSDVARLDLEDLDSPQDYTASIASSNMTLEAATDVTEDYSFDAGEGSGVTDLWDAYGQPTAMYASSDAGADALAEEQEEDVVDAYGQPTPLLPGPGDVQEAFDDADDANSSFGSIAANRISFSEADAQSTFHGPPPPQGLPPADDYTEDELSVPQTWNESPRELATPVFNLPSDLSEHDIVTDYEQMSPEQRHGDESSSDFTADLSAYEATELSASGAAGMVTDDTAELAYLASPTMRPGDNDTLQNLYDHYSVASSSSSPETGVGEVRDLDEMTEAPSSPNGHYADAFEERHDVFEEQPDAFDGRPETFVERKITSEHRAHTFDGGQRITSTRRRPGTQT
ncbi:hypothetical protein BD626DRAFT_157419 [Schizophyllum amplum]|uniref:C3H1-type domain-containing protein n=1 Tax=Schizophyllum amplum TaxID=97359 RepID=A0A550C367_9AGAR|nr:hypothetical protein BD626DRAFT_157419 [Auriculariopsis ampla]